MDAKAPATKNLNVRNIPLNKLVNGQGIVKKKPADEFRERGKISDDILQVFQLSNATPFQCTGRKGFVCFFCNEEFPNPADLRKHTLDTHSYGRHTSLIKARDMSRFYLKVDITDLRCKMCSKDIDDLEQLVQHLHKEHDKKLFSIVKNYMVPFKFDGDALKCFICTTKFHKFKRLLEHMNTHSRNFVCEKCDAGFITRTGLLYHSKSHETGSFECKYCEKVFATLSRQKSHERYVHNGVALNRCRHCSACFRDYHQKVKHLLEAHGVAQKTLKCNACDRTFTNQKHYRNHTKRDHLMERKHTCELCDKKFYTSSELKEHVVKHTGVRKFQCDVCLKAYGRKSTLREHLRIHADDRRFKCEHCGMAFVQRCSWRGHVRAKHGEQV